MYRRMECRSMDGNENFLAGCAIKFVTSRRYDDKFVNYVTLEPCKIRPAALDCGET
jgi:hypothetical protein